MSQFCYPWYCSSFCAKITSCWLCVIHLLLSTIILKLTAFHYGRKIQVILLLHFSQKSPTRAVCPQPPVFRCYLLYSCHRSITDTALLLLRSEPCFVANTAIGLNSPLCSFAISFCLSFCWNSLIWMQNCSFLSLAVAAGCLLDQGFLLFHL